MTKPESAEELIELVRRSGLTEESRLEPLLRNPAVRAADTRAIASAMVKTGILTAFQANCLLAGRYRGLVLGGYKILDKIGQGGMGTVYLGEHVALNRKVAIKVLTVQQAHHDQLATDRFYREARSTAALDHPNIVRVYDVSRTGGAHFIVMEYVEGRTLRALVEKAGPLHYAQAADYVAQAAAGLQHAHEKNLVHRDIKPENLILDGTGTVKILDLGLARQRGETPDNLTQKIEPNVILGTPDYLAPEQAIEGGAVDIRADIYSLGATFFTLVTGRPPFTGTTAQKLARHQLTDPPSLSKLQPNVPPQLAAVVARMLAKKPQDRYQTPQDVVDALTPWLHAGTAPTDSRPAISRGLPAALSRPSNSRINLPADAEADEPAEPTAAPPRADRRKWALIGGGAAAGVLIVIGTVVAFSGSKRKPEAAPEPTPNPAPVTAAPVVPPATPAKPAPGQPKTIYTLDLSGVAPFSLTMQEKNATETHARGQLPAPWVADVYRPTSFKSTPVGEFTAAAGGAGKTVSLRNLEGTFAQFYTGRAIGRVRAGGSYTFRVEYRTAGRAHGEVGVRGGVSGLLPTVRFPLSDTGGDWKATEFVLDSTRDIPLFVIIQNLDDGPDNLLELRAFSVTEQTP